VTKSWAGRELAVTSPTGVCEAPLIVAHEQGFFKEAGLNVVLKKTGDNEDVTAAVGSGKFRTRLTFQFPSSSLSLRPECRVRASAAGIAAYRVGKPRASSELRMVCRPAMLWGPARRASTRSVQLPASPTPTL
jgi:NMT1/THI5 like